jgi:hypothetical protein
MLTLVRCVFTWCFPIKVYKAPFSFSSLPISGSGPIVPAHNRPLGSAFPSLKRLLKYPALFSTSIRSSELEIFPLTPSQVTRTSFRPILIINWSLVPSTGTTIVTGPPSESTQITFEEIVACTHRLPLWCACWSKARICGWLDRKCRRSRESEWLRPSGDPLRGSLAR